MGRIPYEKNDQRSRTFFLTKYGGLSLNDIDTDRRYNINDEEIQCLKKDGYALISNPNNPDVTSTDHDILSLVMPCLK